MTHKDILGNDLKDGNTVAYSHHNNLYIGTVKKSTPKMVMVQKVGSTYSDRKYPSEVLSVDDPKITMYMLKNSK